MILYTMMPQELIFQQSYRQEQSQPKLINHNGIPVIVEENEQKQQQIVRVLSTNPQDYLNENYYPGQILS
ncbi:YlzJ-like family protein [Priestia aryabhattai]|uniref:YlzJ-like family protein n=1 Tax=Priestia aryabhattai TaxID=412384 RepID=UPI001C8E5A69|nr:YlzJ-like family protein [Priestia aryabhattai]MBY0004554.1 YlzJ-like family protein [Priestia aryabhattai]MBY0046161.1 YlzJ-like family protein [Priestia aryabhattai]